MTYTARELAEMAANGIDIDDFVADPNCPTCGGPGALLGALGRRVHFRCRDCGLDFSLETCGDCGNLLIAHEDGLACDPTERGGFDPSQVGGAYDGVGSVFSDAEGGL